MGNRKKIPRIYFVTYTATFAVRALSAGMAYHEVDEELTNMVEGEDYELDEIFDIVVEEKKLHVISDIPVNVINTGELDDHTDNDEYEVDEDDKDDNDEYEDDEEDDE